MGAMEGPPNHHIHQKELVLSARVGLALLDKTRSLESEVEEQKAAKEETEARSHAEFTDRVLCLG